MPLPPSARPSVARPTAALIAATVGTALTAWAATSTTASTDADALRAARDAIRRTADADALARHQPEARRDPAEVDRTLAAYVRACDDAVALAARVVREQPSTPTGLDAAERAPTPTPAP